MRYPFILVILLSLFVLPAPSFAGQVQQQDTSLDSKQLYKRALHGDAWAANYLGYLYQTGKNNVRQSYLSAIQFYTIAANAGYVDAMVNLGNIYLRGYVGGPNPAQAAAWFAAAAQQANPTAEYALGNLYLDGKGVPKDPTKAAAYYMRAAVHGQGSAVGASAQNSLGNMYRDGTGVKQSDQDAIKWYTMAIKGGNAMAQRSLADMYEAGHAKGIMDDKQMVDLYKSAAMKGDADAQFNLGHMYQMGEHGLTADVGSAIKWYRKSANQGNPDAQHALGEAYYKGVGVPQDYQQAWFWYSLGANGSNHAGYGAARDETALHLTPDQLTKAQADVAAWKVSSEISDDN